MKQTLRVTKIVLSHRRYKIIMASTAIIFALSYMFFTGIFVFLDREIPEEFTVPMFRLARIHTEYGDFPWIIAYLDRHTIFSMSTEAMFSTTIISGLVGINSAFLAFRFSSASNKATCGLSKGSVGFFGIIPAFLSIFACCGGGMLVVLFGAGILAALFPYGFAFSIISIATLGLGVLYTTRELNKIL